jgi:hypothetical protein
VRRRREIEEALREETFHPETLCADTLPKKVREIPISAPGRWEDRLYHEYFSQKKLREMEYEQLRRQRRANEELCKGLEECTFQPNVGRPTSRIHSARGSSARSISGTTPRCGADSVVRAPSVHERLYRESTSTAAVDGTGPFLNGDTATERRPQRRLSPQPNDTQLRLFYLAREMRQERESLLQRALEQRRKQGFVLQIKGHFFETPPPPSFVPPQTFERLHSEAQLRDRRLAEQREERRRRRPTPTPSITKMAKKLRSSGREGIFERLTRPRSGSPQPTERLAKEAYSPQRTDIASRPSFYAGAPEAKSPIRSENIDALGATSIFNSWRVITPSSQRPSRQASRWTSDDDDESASSRQH